MLERVSAKVWGTYKTLARPWSAFNTMSTSAPTAMSDLRRPSGPVPTCAKRSAPDADPAALAENARVLRPADQKHHWTPGATPPRRA
jgi:hypothetical protein